MKITTSNWQTYLRLLKVASPYWGSFLVGLIGTLFATGADSLLAWSVKPLVDNGLVNREQWLLSWLPLIIVIIFLVRGITYFFSNYYIVRVGRNVVRDFRQRIFNHFLHLPANFYDRESSGKLLSLLIYNTEQVATACTDAILVILQEGLSLIGLLIVMFIISWQLTLLFLITAPIVSLIIRYNSKRLRNLSSSVQKTMGNLTHVAEESIECYKVVRIFGGENYEQQKFIDATQTNRNREMKVAATSAVGTSLVQIITSIPIAIIVYVAVLPSSHVTVGGFGAIVVAMLRLLVPLRRLTKVNTDIQKGVAGAQSLFETLEEKPEKDIGKINVAAVRGEIEFKKVNFSYEKSAKPVLFDVSFNIEPRQTVALVGRSGSGKSTMVNLLPRFYDVLNGSILIDGKDIQEYKLSDLRKQFALVSQHLTLFNDTIARNIAYGCATMDKNKIISVAEAAHIMEFVRQLPQGLDTMIGENGLLLSGGQRQRIAIARALLKDAPILILDEATSSLDTESENYIQAALEMLMRKRTTLVIAHRLSTVEKADKIMVLDQGRIVESGNHPELLKANGIYAKLYKMQFRDNETI
jgi:ATP-binding cassette, subfamily B, bacterial MsbA